MKVKLSNIILFLIYAYLPLDTINGVLIRMFNISVSPIYKVIILILMLFYLLQKRNYMAFKWILLFFVLFIFHVNMGIFSSLEVFWSLKFLAIIISFFFFQDYVLINGFSAIKKLAVIAFLVIGINVIIGLSGYGYAQYARNDIGTRGLFYAGNEMGIVLLVTSLILLSVFLIKRKVKLYLIFSVFFLFLAGMLTTKTAVLGQIIVICFLPVINFYETKRGFIIQKSSFKILLFGVLVLTVGFPFLVYYTLYEMNLIVRLSFWAGRVDPLTLFFSGRNLLTEDVLTFLEYKNTFINNLIGYGYDSLLEAAGRSVEIDAVDSFMIFGGVGVIFMYGFFITEMRNGLKLRDQKYEFQPYVYFGILLLLILSCLSGHVLNSGMAGIIIGAFIALQYSKSFEKQ